MRCSRCFSAAARSLDPIVFIAGRMPKRDADAIESTVVNASTRASMRKSSRKSPSADARIGFSAATTGSIHAARSKTCAAASRRQKRALRQQLPHDPSPPCAEREADGDFALTRSCRERAGGPRRSRSRSGAEIRRRRRGRRVRDRCGPRCRPRARVDIEMTSYVQPRRSCGYSRSIRWASARSVPLTADMRAPGRRRAIIVQLCAACCVIGSASKFEPCGDPDLGVRGLIEAARHHADNRHRSVGGHQGLPDALARPPDGGATGRAR